jgi:hypothetical protein
MMMAKESPGPEALDPILILFGYIQGFKKFIKTLYSI